MDWIEKTLICMWRIFLKFVLLVSSRISLMTLFACIYSLFPWRIRQKYGLILCHLDLSLHGIWIKVKRNQKMFDLTWKTSDLCFSLFASLSKKVSHNPNTKYKTKSNSYIKVESKQANMKKRKKKKRKERKEKRTSWSNPVWWWGGGRMAVGQRMM